MTMLSEEHEPLPGTSSLHDELVCRAALNATVGTQEGDGELGQLNSSLSYPHVGQF